MVRRRKKNLRTELRLTTEGWVFLVVLAFITIGAVLRNVNLLVVLAGMMYAPLLLNWRMGIRWLSSFQAYRRMPKRLHANELTNVQWTCENKSLGMAAWNLVINDRIRRLPDDERKEPAEGVDLESESQGERIRRPGWFAKSGKLENCSEVKIGFVRIAAEQSDVQAYRVFFSQRGEYEIGPAALSTTFPFGLIVSRIHFPKRETVFVGPEVGELRPTWERRVQSIASGSDTIKRRRALEEDEFYALRPWRSGDSKKNIHWRTSAKYGQPIVKQHDQQNNRDFALVLDLHQSSDSDVVAHQRCETALSFAATAVLQIGNAVQGQIAIGSCGRTTELRHSRSHQGVVVEAMKSLAVAQPSSDPQVASVLLELINLVSSGTPIYVVSSRARPDALDPSKLVTETGQAEQDRLAKRLKQTLPLLRWLEVGTSEFEALFTLGSDHQPEKRLKEFSSKWSSHV